MAIYWTCQDGSRIKITEMRSSHLFYCVRMLWNHNVPPELKLYPYKEYKTNFSSRLTYNYWISLIYTLKDREDLEKWQLQELNFILRMARARDIRRPFMGYVNRV